MKNFLIKKKGAALLISLAAVILIVGSSGITLPDIILAGKALLFGSGGFGAIQAVAGAGAVIAGDTPDTSTQGAKAANLYLDEVKQFITKLAPDKFPLDTILRERNATRFAKSWVVRDYTTDIRGVAAAIGAEFTQSALGAAPAYSIVTVTNPHIFLTDDTITIPTVTGGNGDPLVLAIVSKLADGTLWVFPLNGVDAAGTGAGDYVPDLAIGTAIYRLGNAKTELAAKTSPYTILPWDKENYMQRFMVQVEQSLIDKIALKEVKVDLSMQKNLAMYSFRSDIEASLLWGQKKKFMDAKANEYKYTTGGITHEITKNAEWSASGGIDNAWMNAFAKQVFTGNNGSDRRILFCGSNFLEALQNAPTITKQLEAKKSEIIYGVRFNEIETVFGRFLLKHHQGLDLYGQPDNGILLDMQNVDKWDFQGRSLQVRKLNFTSNGEREADAQKIEEMTCACVTNLDTHCLVTKGV